MSSPTVEEESRNVSESENCDSCDDTYSPDERGCDEGTRGKKCESNVPPKEKPRRPFTAYNIYFQLERNYIIQTADESNIPKMDPDDIDENAASRPAKYRGIIMPKKWYSVKSYSKRSRNKSERNRRGHGVMSFVELSKSIAQNWSRADLETKMYCRDLSSDELIRHREEMHSFVEKYGNITVKRQNKKGKVVPSKGGARDPSAIAPSNPSAADSRTAASAAAAHIAPEEEPSLDRHIPPKPRRPFTSYNIFSQLERSYILQTADKSNIPKLRPDDIDENAASRPSKYHDIVMPKNWYKVKSDTYKFRNKKERHSHGVMTFTELSKAIAKNWNEVDSETKTYCGDLAAEELKRYQSEMDMYIGKYGLASVKRTYKKRDKPEDEGEDNQGGQSKTADQQPSDVQNPDGFTSEAAKKSCQHVSQQSMGHTHPLQTVVAAGLQPYFPLYDMGTRHFGTTMFLQDQQRIQMNRNSHQLINQYAAQNFMAHQQGVQTSQFIANVHAMQLLQQQAQVKSIALQHEVEHLRYVAEKQARELQQYRSKQEHHVSDESATPTMQTEQPSRQEMLVKSIVDSQKNHIKGRAGASNTLLPWTTAEDWILLELEKMHDRQWGLISSLLPGRNHQDAQSRWCSLIASQGMPANGDDNQMHLLAATASLIPSVTVHSLDTGTEEESQQAKLQKFATKVVMKADKCASN